MKMRSGSPVHVHVSEATPVHVYVKSQRSPQEKVRGEKGTLRPTAKVQTRVPEVPQRGTLRDASYRWEGPSHCLEITPQSLEPEGSQSALRLTDLTAAEDGVHGRIDQYQQKIDTLMTEVSSLKNQVRLRQKEQQLDRQSEQLSMSHRVIAEQEKELAAVTKELQETERQNTRLRLSVEKLLQQTGINPNSVDGHQSDRDALLSKLMEAEVDGEAASKQVCALRDSLGQMGSAPNGACSWESSHLDRQKELLLQKLETFEATNKALGSLLREHQRLQTDPAQLSKQKEMLLEKLSITEAENATLVVKLQDKDRQIHGLCRALDNENENARSVSDLSKGLESTRAHLQGQLRSKEAENNRLSVQIKNLERSINEQRAEMTHLREQLVRLKQQSISDKEALKLAARAQKQRAERCQDTADQLHRQLLEMEKQVTEAQSAAESWQSCHREELKEKKRLELELSTLNSRVVELSEQLRSAENKGRLDRDALVQHLHGLTSENTAAKLKTQSLKAAVSTLEEKLSLSQSELDQVKSTIKQYESLIDSYQLQVGKTRSEADEYCARLAQAECDALTLRGNLDQEVEQVRRDLLGRLAELEPLPEALRHAELKLQEAQEREVTQESRYKELNKTMNELLLKVEAGSSQTELLKQNNKVLLEENRKLQLEVENLERMLKEAGSHNCELLTVVGKWEDSLVKSQLCLEEKNRECSLLNRKLEEALTDAQQQITGIRQLAADRERCTQSKILELETQLGHTTSEITQLRNSKGEAEHRYQSRLQDLKDRLEQSDSTNRSLQNYVQFLKASYANVFGDSSLSSTFRAPSPI